MSETTAIQVEAARVVFDDRVETAAVRFEDGRITAIDGPRDGAELVDGSGLLLAPGLVDIHGDAFERQLMPRPGVTVPVEPALLETDRQLAANGVSTAYHALTLGWEPGLRSVATGRAIIDALQALQPRLTVENRVQLRWETFCFEAVDLIRDTLAGPLAPAIAFNDHTSMAMLDPSVPLQQRPFDHAPDYPIVDVDSSAFAAKMETRAKRSHMSAADFVQLIRGIWDRRPEVPATIAKVATEGRAVGVPMLSHDDSRIETRAYYRGLGARLSEFPMNRTVARAAHEAGDIIVFGAPNAARGGSHIGSLAAADMIRDGLCDVLASDYFYPAMLLAVARLKADAVAPLSQLWALVSRNPARACRLDDRGSIAVGQRADLLLVDWPEGAAPAVLRTWVCGREAYRAGPAG
ncbi:MAG: alpha-D-ribose 1-methylphosphonate 5-triphosphate diphosphatase [Ancalomicrobiaceae bacterium]|nr:alpha-D-ribose 1-methylphosphonate 5-triphosphate diphosphatase [Ancalomicrobiaceae bacterium]